MLPEKSSLRRDLALFIAWLAIIGLCLNYGRTVNHWFQGVAAVWASGAMILAGLTLAALAYRRWRALPGSQKRRAAFLLTGAGVCLLLLAWAQPLLIERTHLFIYGVLGYLAHRLWGHGLSGWPRALAAGASCALVGVLDEAGQHLHPQRFGDLPDMATNAASAALVVAALWGMETSAPLRSNEP